MAGLIVVWANISDEAMKWYLEDYIPEMNRKHATWTLHCELTESGFEGDPIGQLDAPWQLCTIYETPDVEDATACVYDKSNHPTEEMLTGMLAKARFDVRTYRTLQTWKKDDWEEDAQDVGCSVLMEWAIPNEMHDEVMDWYLAYTAPLLANSPECVRFRLLEVDNATVLEGMSYETKEKSGLHTYLSVMELDTPDWPWEQVLELADDEGWKKYFESRVVKFQIGSYVVQRVYEEEQQVASKE